MKIHTFKIQKEIGHTHIILFPTLIEIKGKKYLVDCGYRETFSEFVSELHKLGVEIKDLHGILISHDDIDHIGALKQFKQINQDVIIYSSDIEAPSISGKIKSERLEQAERSLPNLTDEYKSWATQFIEQLKNISRLEVDITLKNSDKIDDELEVIYTPGHTKGHISFYSFADKTLIANDALVLEDGEFNIANPTFTLDMQQAIKSIESIKQINPDKIICYHGGIAETDIAEKLTRLIKRYKT